MTNTLILTPQQNLNTREDTKVLVTEPVLQLVLNILSKIGKVDYKPDIFRSRTDLLQKISNYDVIVVRSDTEVDRELIECATKLQVIARLGNGTNNIDIQAAERYGIAVVNSRTGNTISTVEHTIAMMLALSRNIAYCHEEMANGKWNNISGVEVQGKNLLVIGNGNIGSQVAYRAYRGLGMNVSVVSKSLSPQKARKLGYRLVNMEKGLKEADFVSVHVPKTSETINLISNRELALMKPTARIINCARGGIINEEALIQALQQKRIAGAALDVFNSEQQPVSLELRELAQQGKVVLTPHIGGSTTTALKKIAEEVTQKVRNELLANRLTVEVDKPELAVA